MPTMQLSGEDLGDDADDKTVVSSPPGFGADGEMLLPQQLGMETVDDPAVDADTDFDDQPTRAHFPPEDMLASAIAGAWKQNDLPPPVGRTTRESRRFTTHDTASSCRGRNVSKPQYFFRMGRRSISGCPSLKIFDPFNHVY